jgi:hypothetical protein
MREKAASLSNRAWFVDLEMMATAKLAGCLSPIIRIGVFKPKIGTVAAVTSDKPRVGQILTITGIDELPQLINVMSIVGRPI